MVGIDRLVTYWADHRPDHPAVVIDGCSVTYRQLDRLVVDRSIWLSLRGVGAGDRVAFCGLNRVEMIELLLACACLGAVLVPINNRLTATEIGFQLADSAPVLALVSDGFGPTMRRAAGRDLAGIDLPIEDLDIMADDLADEHGARLGSDGAETSEPLGRVSLDAPVLMVYTSGTTGRPKGAVHTQRSILFTVLNGVAHQDLTAGDRVLTVLPLFHVGGLNIQTLPALSVGATVILQRRFEAGETLELMERHRPTQTLLVPAVMEALLGHPDLDRVDFRMLRGINSGSSVVPDHLIRAFIDRGVPVGQVYGSTETGPSAVVLRYEDGAANVGSCGRPALYCELRIVGADGADGEAGELLVRGPNLFDHYHGRPDETAAAFVDGWYRTGDVGHRDPEGWVYIEDRLGDVLISGGENVYPAEVEIALAEHPGIEAVAIVGRPHPRWGEVPVAVIEATEGEPTPTVEEVRAWCADRLARYKQPRHVVIVDRLPRTALGKVTKHILRTELAAGSWNDDR